MCLPIANYIKIAQYITKVLVRGRRASEKLTYICYFSDDENTALCMLISLCQMFYAETKSEIHKQETWRSYSIIFAINAMPLDNLRCFLIPKKQVKMPTNRIAKEERSFPRQLYLPPLGPGPSNSHLISWSVLTPKLLPH